MVQNRVREKSLDSFLPALFLVALSLLVGCARGPALDPAEAAAAADFAKRGGRVRTEIQGEMRTVVEVDLRRTGVTDQELVSLMSLPNTRSLRLGRTEIGDEALAYVAGLTHLKELYLGRTNVTDQGLVHLKGLSELEWLAVNRTEVTAAGFKKLKKSLPKLKRAK